MAPSKNIRAKAGNRHGGALMELAVVLPVMFLVILGSIDICNSIFVKQFITEITYQGAMEGSDPLVSEAELIDSLNAYLTARGIEDASVIVRGIDGAEFDAVPRGELFEVIVGVDAEHRDAHPFIVQYIDLNARSVAARQ